MVFIIVKFLKDHPERFQGVDGKLYGGFVKGQNVALPASNARLLIKMGVAESMRKIVEEPGLKKVFKGEVLTGFVEAARAKTLNRFQEPKGDPKLRESLKQLKGSLERLDKARRELEKARR